MKTECKKEKENIKDSDLKRNEQLVCGCGKSNIWLSNAIGYCNYCFGIKEIYFYITTKPIYWKFKDFC